MITGFNTDVEYDGVIYHIQTEDKGMDTPLILSLVYDRGTILASKRSPYDDLLNGKLDEKILAERLQKQHKTICAAVSAGRIEDLKRMSAKDAAARQKNGQAPDAAVKTASKSGELNKNGQISSFQRQTSAAPARISQNLAEKIDTVKTAPQPLKLPKTAPPESEQAIPKPEQELVWDVPVKVFEDELISGSFEIIEEEPILEAVQILTDFAKPTPLRAGKLQIEFVTETAFRGGDRKTVSIFVHRGGRGGSVRSGVGGAQVMLKVLGSSFRPLIFHAATDSNGIATVHLQLPHFHSGRAAILVRAMSGGEEVELRRVVAHG